MAGSGDLPGKAARLESPIGMGVVPQLEPLDPGQSAKSAAADYAEIFIADLQRLVTGPVMGYAVLFQETPQCLVVVAAYLCLGEQQVLPPAPDELQKLAGAFLLGRGGAVFNDRHGVPVRHSGYRSNPPPVYSARSSRQADWPRIGSTAAGVAIPIVSYSNTLIISIVFRYASCY